MKTYNIKVNGIAYEVEVEEVGAGAVGNVQMAAPVVRPAAAPMPPQTPKAAAPKAPVAEPTVGAEAIAAPMPGTILDVKVTPGQSVKSGDILLILEAMKMENEIMAPRDGVIDTVQTTKGATVNAGDMLVTLK